MPKKQFDLHIHSYYSDGQDSPQELLRRAKKSQLQLTSITDHNSISHWEEEEQLAQKLRLNFIKGAEFSTIYEGRHLHLLGYDFKKSSPELKKIVNTIQQKRKKGILTIAHKLRNIGFDIPDSELQRLKAEYLGLAHIIRALLKKPQEKRRILKEAGSSDIFAIIKHYFSAASEAYVPEDYLPAVKMIKLIKSSGGIVILAHPGAHLQYKNDDVIVSLRSCGLEGIEVFTPKHNWDQIIHYEVLAKKLKMTITAGSNYHEDFHQQDIPVVTPLGFLKTPPLVFDNFLKFLKKKTGYRLKY